MQTLNFTQFCSQNGYPCDNDTMFQAQILGSRGLAGKVSNRAIKNQDNEFSCLLQRNKQAHEHFYNAVKNGEILDASGKLTKESILKKENEIRQIEIQSKINQAQNYIDFIKSMKTSYLKNGNLKKGYQIAVDEHENKISQLKQQL